LTLARPTFTQCASAASRFGGRAWRGHQGPGSGRDRVVYRQNARRRPWRCS